MKNIKILHLAFFAICLALLFSVSGCVEIFKKIKVNKDGSGTANIGLGQLSQ